MWDIGDPVPQVDKRQTEKATKYLRSQPPLMVGGSAQEGALGLGGEGRGGMRAVAGAAVPREVGCGWPVPALPLLDAQPHSFLGRGQSSVLSFQI